MYRETLPINGIRDVPPCKGCTEKFTACHDRCPKDERGEFGYKAWKEKLEKVKAERKKYENKPFVRYNPFDY